jgi:hypothetical protein
VRGHVDYSDLELRDNSVSEKTLSAIKCYDERLESVKILSLEDADPTIFDNSSTAIWNLPYITKSWTMGIKHGPHFQSPTYTRFPLTLAQQFQSELSHDSNREYLNAIQRAKQQYSRSRSIRFIVALYYERG